MSISNSVVCYYAEKWKCSDGNVIEFDKTWTSRISLERHWYVLFFISNVSRCTECTEMHMCLCTCGDTYPQWAKLKRSIQCFKRRYVAIISLFTVSVFHIVEYLIAGTEVTEIRNPCCSKIDNGCMLSTNSACETLICIAQSSWFVVNFTTAFCISKFMKNVFNNVKKWWAKTKYF